MATIQPTIVDKDNGTTKIVTWVCSDPSDIGAPVEFTTHGDRCVQASGDASGQFDLEGSNDGVNWSPVADVLGTSIGGAALDSPLSQIMQVPVYIRPNITFLTAGICTITVIMRRNNPSRQ